MSVAGSMSTSKYDRLIGTKVDKWSVISFDRRDEKNFRYYNCICECGNTNSVLGRALYCGESRSCGCWNSELTRSKVLFTNNMSLKNRLLRNYKKDADERGYNFELTKEQFIDTIEKNCNYCGVKPSNMVRDHIHGKVGPGYYYNGVDRIDNLLGYSMDNIVPCCKQCNWSKQRSTTEEYLTWVTRVYNHSVNNGDN